MWPRSRKAGSRRAEIRRSKAQRGLAWYRRIALPLNFGPAMLTIGLGLVTAGLLNVGTDPLKVRVNDTLGRALTARVEFERVNAQRTQEMRIQARDGTPNYYRLDELLLASVEGRLMSAFRLAQEHREDPVALRKAGAEFSLVLGDDALAELVRLAQDDDASGFEQQVQEALSKLRQQPIVEATPAGSQRTAVYAMLVDADRPKGESRPVGLLLPSTAPESAARAAEAAAVVFDPPLRGSMQQSLAKMLRAADGSTPIYRYDRDRSLTAAQAEYNAVETEKDTYPLGATLADAGPVTAAEIELLEAERAAFEAQRRTQPDGRVAALLVDAGRSILAILIVIGLALHVFADARATISAGRRWGLVVVAITMLAAARISYTQFGIPHATLGAQLFAAGLFAIIAARARVTSLAGGLAVLIAIATRESIGFMLILMAPSMIMLNGLRDIRNRGKIVAVGAGAAVFALLANLATGLVQGEPLRSVLMNEAVWSVGTALAAGFLIEGLLPGLERVFGLSTNMTLLEWCDANKPLLRMMAAEAPGTYNHSLLVGALAEASAESVGVNGLLCRAGAYYHDIGKINKPGYFVENQQLGISRHDRLTPAMSHLIIIGHVKDGIEMAREYAIPMPLHAFIAEHHGTTLVEYFYHAASKQRKPGDAEVSESSFRYPGPKPQTIETAILMMADAVEGAVRAMPEPTPGRIEDTVARIIQKRLTDGQFDECDLTFRELATIEKTLVKTLCGIYHARIAYPEKEDKPQTRKSPAIASQVS